MCLYADVLSLCLYAYGFYQCLYATGKIALVCVMFSYAINLPGIAFEKLGLMTKSGTFTS